jgi:hypothetical protein
MILDYCDNPCFHSNLTKTAPASLFFGVDASFRYGNETILNTSPGFIDTGTTLIGLETSMLIHDSYQICVLSHIYYIRRV